MTRETGLPGCVVLMELVPSLEKLGLVLDAGELGRLNALESPSPELSVPCEPSPM